MRSLLKSTLTIITLLFALNSNVEPQGVTLVDFGSSSAENAFELEGWNNLILSGNQSYTTAGNGGVVVASNVEEFTDYRGVQGIPRNFELGERSVYIDP